LAESDRNLSSRLIGFLGHAFLYRSDDVITSRHAFITCELIATLFGARTIEADSPNYEHDLETMLEAITPRAK